MQIKFSPKKYLILLICTYFVSNIYTQNLIHGVVFEKDRAIPIVGAVVSIGSKGTITDTDGKFSLEKEVNQNYMVVSFTGFKKTRILLSESNEYNIKLEEESVLLQTTVISSSRFETSIAQSSVSMEVIAAKDIEKLSTNSVEQVLDRVPGVQILDGQANIRGGSGYSYGAGSRVMLVM
ncbi:MAG TPA: carboxypeptidase-like regulatory domain-containing protein, partial [Saprospiraceae bacterium]|nr:carboxypeptidase-like regulatory domain-containing protein [Saprospiraceae bacterium]